MKYFLIILALLIPLSVIAFIAASNASITAHNAAMSRLCNEVLTAPDLTDDAPPAEVTDVCVLVENDEFMVFHSSQDDDFEMVCYDHLGSPYSFEEQGCSIITAR